MNQNGQNNQEMKQNLSQEELAKTQVLNLNELQTLAKIEKKTSKRPAIMLALAGILALTVGFSYDSLMSAIDSIPPKKYEYRVRENIAKENVVTCSALYNGVQDGLTGTITYYFTFNKLDELQSYTTDVSFTTVPGNPAGVETATKLSEIYKLAASQPVTGYSVETSFDGTLLKETTKVDLTLFNAAELKAEHAASPYTLVPYKLNDSKETILKALANYQCK